MHSTQSLDRNSKHVSIRITKDSWETLPTNLIFAIPASLLFKKELPLRISAGGCVTVIVKTYKGIYFSVKCVLIQSKYQVWKTSFPKGGAVTKLQNNKKGDLYMTSPNQSLVLLPHHEPLSSLQPHWSSKSPHRTWPSAKRNYFLAVLATGYTAFKTQQHQSETGTRYSLPWQHWLCVSPKPAGSGQSWDPPRAPGNCIHRQSNLASPWKGTEHHQQVKQDTSSSHQEWGGFW